jgi:uncharacterized protein
MEFEWDEDKREANLEKHGYDFLRAIQVFSGEHVVVPSRYGGVEPRWLAIGKIDDREVTVVFTMRGTTRRVISMRRASSAERKIYQTVHG